MAGARGSLHLTTERERRRLEESYEDSIFGAFRARWSMQYPSACRDLLDAGGASVSTYIDAVVATRGTQPIMHELLRGRTRSAKVCAPHLPVYPRVGRAEESLPLDGRAWGVVEKFRATLAQQFAYAYKRCEDFRGAVLYLSVRVGEGAGPDNHANFVYLDLEPTPAVAYLFEPNGPQAARKADGLAKVTAAVAGANRLLRATAFATEVRLPGSRGVQSALGVVARGRGAVNFGICGAVTTWLLHEWVAQGAALALDAFTASLEARVAADPQLARDQIVDFMRTSTANARAHMAAYTRETIRRDLARFRAEDCRPGCTPEDVVVRIALALGPVTATIVARLPPGCHPSRDHPRRSAPRAPRGGGAAPP